MLAKLSASVIPSSFNVVQIKVTAPAPELNSGLPGGRAALRYEIQELRPGEGMEKCPIVIQGKVGQRSCVAEGEPSKFGMFLIYDSRFSAIPTRHGIHMICDGVGWRSVWIADRAHEGIYCWNHGDFFTQLPDEGCGSGLALIHMPSGETPDVRIGAPLRASPSKEDTTVLKKQGVDDVGQGGALQSKHSGYAGADLPPISSFPR